MKRNTLYALVAAGVLAVSGGWYFGTRTVPPEQQTTDAGTLMFPGLARELPGVTRIEIVHQGKTTTIERHNGDWGLTDRDFYPVQDTRLRGMLTALTELRLSEPRTSDPAQYSRLGVEDADRPDSGSNLLRLVAADGHPVATLLVGHRRVRAQGHVAEDVYVRRPNDAQAWLAQGNLQVDTDPQVWLDRDVINLAPDRLATVTITRGGATLRFRRESDRLAMTEPAEHPPLDASRVEDIGRGLERLTFQDVRRAVAPTGEPTGQVTYGTTDGLAVTVTVRQHDKDLWTRFSVEATDDKAKPEAARLAARLSPWEYQLGSWKEKALVPTLDELKAAAAPASPGAPAMPDAAASPPAAAPSAASPSAAAPSAAAPARKAAGGTSTP